MKRKWLILAVIYLVAIPAACLLTLVLIPQMGTDVYPDFRHFPTANDLKVYLEQELPLNRTQMADVERFIFNQNMSARCVNRSSEIYCEVLAPIGPASWDQALFAKFIALFTYRISFRFVSDTLSEIVVHAASQSF